MMTMAKRYIRLYVKSGFEKFLLKIGFIMQDPVDNGYAAIKNTFTKGKVFMKYNIM